LLAIVNLIPVVGFNVSITFAVNLLFMYTFALVAITVRGDEHGLGGDVQVTPTSGDILSPINTGAKPFTLTFRDRLAAQSIGVGGVLQGQFPPVVAPLL